jgi:hypothetical protein
MSVIREAWMQIGQWKVDVVNAGFFRLDGGTMFGTVPKVVWKPGK